MRSRKNGATDSQPHHVHCTSQLHKHEKLYKQLQLQLYADSLTACTVLPFFAGLGFASPSAVSAGAALRFLFSPSGVALPASTNCESRNHRFLREATVSVSSVNELLIAVQVFRHQLAVCAVEERNHRASTATRSQCNHIAEH